MHNDDEVIHVTAAAHRAAREYCRTRGLRVKAWASKLILDAAAPVGPVERRELVRLDDEPSEAVELPPFWAKG